MSVNITSYGGRLGFAFRKYFPKLSFSGYLLLNSLRKKEAEDYIKKCLETNERYQPILVHIETINRCNATCSFCPANINDEKRPYSKMDYELFMKIINDLADINYRGIVCFFLNNEPFMDNRIPDMVKVARDKLPNATLTIYTNGTLLTKEKLNSIAGYVNHLRINNYNHKYELTESSKMIYEHVKQNEVHFKNTKVVIELRYSGEYLSNRAGSAPNKAESAKVMSSECILPFTDISIFPDGTIGLCSSDVHEKTNLGNVKEKHILEIFHDKKFKDVRKMIYPNRSGIDFCKNCDFMDRGARLSYFKAKLSANK